MLSCWKGCVCVVWGCARKCGVGGCRDTPKTEDSRPPSALHHLPSLSLLPLYLSQLSFLSSLYLHFLPLSCQGAASSISPPHRCRAIWSLGVPSRLGIFLVNPLRWFKDPWRKVTRVNPDNTVSKAASAAQGSPSLLSWFPVGDSLGRVANLLTSKTLSGTSLEVPDCRPGQE